MYVYTLQTQTYGRETCNQQQIKRQIVRNHLLHMYVILQLVRLPITTVVIRRNSEFKF